TNASSPDSTAAVPLNAARDSLRDEPPLVVDLDGCLVRSDLLIESALALVRRNPAFALSLPLWLLRGKASLKREIAARVDVDVASLPYADDLLLHLKSEQDRKSTRLNS